MHAREKEFATNNYRGASDGQAVRFTNRGSPVLVVALHSVVHKRNGLTKAEDRLTGSIAEALAEATGVNSLVALRTTLGEGTWSERSDEVRIALDQAFASGTKFVVDIHGMNDKWGIDWCIGTGPTPSKLTSSSALQLMQSCPELRVEINAPFPGRQSFTVTHYAQTVAGLDALQLEMSASFRNTSHKQNKEEIEAGLTALCTWLAQLAVAYSPR